VSERKKLNFHYCSTGCAFFDLSTNHFLSHIMSLEGVSAVGVFLLSPFLGRRIAYDPEFKETYVPKWFHQFVPERPKNAWTKEELQNEITMLQTKLHERAIAGEFTPEKLDVMRRTMNKKLPDKVEYAHFAQMHPGVDDDEDLEDE
jgi:hypothetical protein